MAGLPAGFAAGARLGRRWWFLFIVWPRRLFLGQIVEAILNAGRLRLKFLGTGRLLVELCLQLGVGQAKLGDELIAQLTSGAAGRVRQVVDPRSSLHSGHGLTHGESTPPTDEG